MNTADFDLATRLDFAAPRAARIAVRRGVQHLATRAHESRHSHIVTDPQDPLELIEETLAQDWPRCGGDRIDPADAWDFAGFADDQVVAWLEVGVPRAAAAVRLDRAGITPAEVLRQFEVDVTYGLAFSRGDVDLETIRRLRRA